MLEERQKEYYNVLICWLCQLLLKFCLKGDSRALPIWGSRAIMPKKLKEVMCSICMLVIFNIGGWTWYCAMWNIMNLDFAIFRDNLISCSHPIILSNSRFFFFVSSPIFLNSFLCSVHINVVSSARMSVFKVFRCVFYIIYVNNK